MLQPFPVRQLGKSSPDASSVPGHVETFRWSFRTPPSVHCRSGCYFIVEAEKFDYDVYVIKFYEKKNKTSPDKYRLDSKAHVQYRTMATIYSIAIQILESNPKASFAFVGMPGIRKNKERSVEVETKYPSIRFRMYKRMVMSLPVALNFIHRYFEEQNAYLLMNRSVDRIAMVEKDIYQMFVRGYNDMMDPRVGPDDDRGISIG